ncbi:peptidoglycan-binding protein [Christensenella timonensis]|uniref:C40 family peptidase n=1 Tax=Christensenella timonensis TaxID=1816678 RepID=UPI00082F0C32|nr:peptidoglycan-binding protein [Christensenella timonensis]
MKSIISNVKDGLLKTVGTVKGKLSEVTGNISNMRKVQKRKVLRTYQNTAVKRSGGVSPMRASRMGSAASPQPTGRVVRRYAAKKVNMKRFTAVIAIALVAVMVPVMVLAANGDATQTPEPETTPVVAAAATAESPSEAPQVSETKQETTQVSEESSSLTAESVETPEATAEPEPTPEPTPQYVTLTAGMNDPSVPALQQRLMDLHYMSQDQTTDYFGPATLMAVQAFQRKHGLDVDGAAGAETQAAIFSADAKEYTAALGADGDDVSRIQERLLELGYNVSVTGHFGEMTDKAVREFQRMCGLTDDGSVGSVTKDVLFSDNAEPSTAKVEADKKAAEEEKKKEESSSSNKGNGSSSSDKGSSSSGSSGSSSSGGSSSGGSSSKPSYSADPGNVEAFIDVAMAQVGKPYRLGGKGPDSFDCSGFVYYALRESGNGIGYMTSGGWAGAGFTTVGWDDLERGDILCLSGHVAIYLGDNTVVDASSSSGKIVVRSMGSYFSNNFICAKRPL